MRPFDWVIVGVLSVVAFVVVIWLAGAFFQSHVDYMRTKGDGTEFWD